MEKVALPKKYTIELSAYMRTGETEAPYAVTVYLKKAHEYGTYIIGDRTIRIDGFNREQMERLVNDKIDELLVDNGLTPEQIDTFAQFEAFVKEFNTLYPSLEEEKKPEPVKKKWWQR